MFARLLSYHLAAFALTRPQKLSRLEIFFLLALHAIGLSVLAQLARVPLWLVWGIIVAFGVAAFVPRVREVISPALLASFWFVYAALGARYAWIRVAGGDVPGYFEYTLPDVRVLLRFEFFVGAAILYALLIAAALMVSRTRALRLGAAAGAGALLVWACAEFFVHRTFGATGSDPYAYVQMGVDLATRGTFAHAFPAFALISKTQLPWFPILHVGYRLPYDAPGDAITVWSPGGAVAYAAAFAVGGENALYWVNPFFSILGALVSALLAWELMRTFPQTWRVVTAALVCALLLTSHEIVNWAGVTMADTQALVFSTLAFYFSLRVYRGAAWPWALLAGICWGVAYEVRHTQLVIVAGILPLFFFARARRRNLALLFGAAFLVALPDLWYHHAYLGNWLTPESEELALFSLGAMLPTLAALGQSAFVAAEFGWLLLFVLCGMVLYARRARIENLALLLWLGAALFIHLPYAALRLRDLIPQFPIVAFYAAFGLVGAGGALWAKQRAWATLTAGFVIFFALGLNLARVWHTLPRAWQTPPARFGAMTQAQRASFDILARVTPPNALVGASLNSGAIDLYAGRSAFRPVDWCAENDCAALNEFFEIARREGRDIYILEDNSAVSQTLETVRKQHFAEFVATLDVPLFGNEAIKNPGALWRIAR